MRLRTSRSEMAFHLIFPSRRHFWLPLCSNLETKTSKIVESHGRPLFTGAGNATINYFNVFRKPSITAVDAMNLKPWRCARVVETGTAPIIDGPLWPKQSTSRGQKTKSFHKTTHKSVWKCARSDEIASAFWEFRGNLRSRFIGFYRHART